MAHEQLSNEIPTIAVMSLRVARSARLPVWAALFASGVAAVGTVALAPAAAAAPAPADPPPCWQCDIQPFNPDVINVNPDVINRMPNPNVTETVPAPGDFTPPGAPQCGRGMYWSITAGRCEPIVPPPG
jgi:hypothetical protein